MVGVGAEVGTVLHRQGKEEEARWDTTERVREASRRTAKYPCGCSAMARTEEDRDRQRRHHHRRHGCVTKAELPKYAMV
ncbi:hypothetical protein NDU88_005413 [Pleurodeles waltl]|uniref:Uncharacterized protein n=1 Tax=Pleurodeles waltl TaxID=8319 RepID=A0AAV7SLJ7_PLEWA|nr:hypothetical protein NDU88_005413 [Pleurodeles waltl]